MLQSVSRALDILITVSDMQGKPITLSEISQKTGIHLSTCAHIVKTLCEKGFLSQISRSTGYVLGAYTYYLSRYKTFQKELVSICNPVLKWLYRNTGYAALLAILVDGEKFVISYAEDRNGNLHNRGELYIGDIYSSVTGRLMLSNMRKQELRNLVDKIGLPDLKIWPGIHTFESLFAELQHISKQKVVCLFSDSGSDHNVQIGARIQSSSMLNCAIGINIQQDIPLSIADLERIQKALNIGVREINRRLKFNEVSV